MPPPTSTNERPRRGSLLRQNACLTAVTVFMLIYSVLRVEMNMSMQVRQDKREAEVTEKRFSRHQALQVLKEMGVLNNAGTAEEVDAAGIEDGSEVIAGMDGSAAAPTFTAATEKPLASPQAQPALVDSAWLHNASASSQLKLLVLDCSPLDTFLRGHISFAVPFAQASSSLKSPTSTSVISENKFRHIVKWLKVPKDATIVFYDDAKSLKAIRSWWVFRHYGFPVERLKVLDGGLKQWITAGNRLSTGQPEPTPVASSNSSEQQKALATTGQEDCEKDLWGDVKNMHFLVGLDAVKHGIADASTQFVDARTADEYAGQSSTGNARVGHIPGAINFAWTDAIADTSTFKSKGELEELLLDQLHLDKDKPVIAYCQRAVRGSHVAFTLEQVLGFTNVKIYEDSMQEYLNRDDTEVEL